MANIIVADDHPIVLSGIEAVLTDAGHHIASSSGTGEGAIAATEGDLFLIDLWMPLGSGVDVLRAVRARGDTRPFILMTGSAESDALREALDLGASGLVLKGSAPGQLVTCIERVLAGERWIDPALLEENSVSAEAASSPFDALSSRERSIVKMVATGMRNRDIGERLGMTEANVKVTLHRLYERLGVSNRVELAMMAQSLIKREPLAA